MTIAIANDHNGLELKQKLTEYLTNKGYNIVNCGTMLDREIKDMIKNGTNMKGEVKEYNFGDIRLKGIYNMLPIVSNEGIIGSIVVFSDNNGFANAIIINENTA